MPKLVFPGLVRSPEGYYEVAAPESKSSIEITSIYQSFVRSNDVSLIVIKKEGCPACERPEFAMVLGQLSQSLRKKNVRVLVYTVPKEEYMDLNKDEFADDPVVQYLNPRWFPYIVRVEVMGNDHSPLGVTEKTVFEGYRTLENLFAFAVLGAHKSIKTVH